MQFRRIIYAALLVAAWSPLSSAAKGGAAADSPPPSKPEPGTPHSLSQPPTQTSSATTVSSPTTTSKRNNNALVIASLWRVSREFGILNCLPPLLPLVTSLPQGIPSELLGADMIKQALAQSTLSLDQVCEYHVTGTAGAAFSSFLPQWYGWYDEHADDVRRLVEKCPKVGALTQTAEAYRACTQVVDIMATTTAEEASSTAAADTKVKVSEEKRHSDEKMEL
ncbi:hypothetical protein PGQ11_010871 [Apiospora arundinis]|uniref:Uncharacterized protein n=1 Tax=Apiospora arundinis TaxID=335852 RepID=A0ABR2IBJ6_9PEZI